MESISLGKRIFSTRGGTLAVGVLAAGLAALLLLVYLNRYRQNLNQANAPIAVLVAKRLIPKGTPGDVIGTKALFQATSVPKAQLKDGALTDPAVLRGQIALADIYPGQQLTIAYFGPARTGAVADALTGLQRAVAIPVDATHGLIGQVRPGDHVDLMVGLNAGASARGVAVGSVIKTFLQDITVLNAAGGILTLRVNDKQAERLAWASDNGKIWVILRAPTGSQQSPPAIVSLTNVLFGGTR
ncbi:MAG: Flp pilus assembly protein CpaB [Actinomycetota bacterium]|nr:Flp pilus assembly protein CpaB [Actinomycetota bacterium]